MVSRRRAGATNERGTDDEPMTTQDASKTMPEDFKDERVAVFVRPEHTTQKDG